MTFKTETRCVESLKYESKVWKYLLVAEWTNAPVPNFLKIWAGSRFTYLWDIFVYNGIPTHIFITVKNLKDEWMKIHNFLMTVPTSHNDSSSMGLIIDKNASVFVNFISECRVEHLKYLYVIGTGLVSWYKIKSEAS